MSKVVELLRDKACYYLDHTCETIDKSLIHVPSPDTIDKVWIDSDRNIRVLNSLQTLLGHGRLANTGYVSILPVDQDIEHTAGASFAPNPIYFDPENIVKLAIEGGCNGVASTFGILGSVARKYAHKIPFLVRNRAAVSSWRLPMLLNMLTNWGWQPFFGVTCVIMISRKVLSIIMRLPI